MAKALKVTRQDGSTYTAKLKSGTTAEQAEKLAKDMLRDCIWCPIPGAPDPRFHPADQAAHEEPERNNEVWECGACGFDRNNHASYCIHAVAPIADAANAARAARVKQKR